MRTELLVESQIIAFEFDRIVLLNARHVLAMGRALNAGTPEQTFAFAGHVAQQAN